MLSRRKDENISVIGIYITGKWNWNEIYELNVQYRALKQELW